MPRSSRGDGSGRNDSGKEKYDLKDNNPDLWEGARDYDSIEYRVMESEDDLNSEQDNRFMTGIKSIDRKLGGLAPGINLFWGLPGSGKSMMSKAIASSVAKNRKEVMYVCTEGLTDAPFGPNVTVVNWTKSRPNWKKAMVQLLDFVQEQQPDLLVVDSFTTFISSNAALDEADMREAASELQKAVEYSLPLIATSQIRGSGNYIYPAGGQGVAHAAMMQVNFNVVKIDGKYESNDWGEPDGAIVHTLQIDKDRQGAANSVKTYKVKYASGVPSLVPKPNRHSGSK